MCALSRSIAKITFIYFIYYFDCGCLLSNDRITYSMRDFSVASVDEMCVAKGETIVQASYSFQLKESYTCLL